MYILVEKRSLGRVPRGQSVRRGETREYRTECPEIKSEGEKERARQLESLVSRERENSDEIREMYNAERVVLARNLIKKHKITEEDVFNQDKKERFQQYLNFMATEGGRHEEARKLETAFVVVQQNPSREIITWAEDILEWDGLGLERGGDLEPGGYVWWYRRTYMQCETDTEISIFNTATQVARAMRGNKEAMRAAKVRHAAKAQRREEDRKEYVAARLFNQLCVTWDDFPPPLVFPQSVEDPRKGWRLTEY